MWPRLAIAALALLTAAGCGYRWVSPESGAEPLAPGLVRLGDVRDTTAEGDLGLHAVHRLRLRLAAAGALVDDRSRPRLQGVVRALEETPLAFRADRLDAARVTGVELELWTIGPAGVRSWTSGPIRVSRPWLRGPDPVASRAQRRSMMLLAIDEAVDEAIRRLGDAAPLARRVQEGR